MNRIRRLPLALALIAGLAGCHTSFVRTTGADAQLITTAYPSGEIRAAVVRALEDRNFATVSEEPGRILARFDKHGTSLRVAVEYSETQYLVRYVDSEGFKTEKSPSGETLIEDKYASLVKGLNKSIDQELKRPAKELAKAQRREQEYQMWLE